MPRLTEVAVRLAAMDAQGVDIQLVSPSPSHYHYWAGPRLAEKVCRLANEGTAAHCAKAPARLHGLGLVPLQHPDLAVEGLDHALAQGLRGVEISSHAPGPGGTREVELSDPRLAPFWARAEESGALVFLHPFGCTLDERLDQWYLSNTVGQPTENAVALSHLIFSGVLDRHPDLKVIAAHGGGYLPTQIGRSDHAWRVRPDAQGCAREPSSYLERLYFDSLVHDPDVLRELVRAAGPERTGRLLRAGVRKIWGPGRHMAGDNTFTYFLDPHGNTVEYTTELEALDEDTWHPHVYDFSRPEVTDQWGTANPMNELIAKESFNDVDRGVFVAPPV
ncbi:amidohydrolase family protein [Streptomyces sp. NPDC050287]|uniref:amidohydrolase family protein n=1 Tax=Streptomyces sp. NPDC050287 TaxID=3365608 RepID=UPI0037AEFAE0